MSDIGPNIEIPVDLLNPGQFFACCGLLELADRLWPGAEGWFTPSSFSISGDKSLTFAALFRSLSEFRVRNTMTPEQDNRLELLSRMKKREFETNPELEDEKKGLEALRRDEPIVFEGAIRLRVDWFHDDFAGGARFKTWAGQQSVLDIARSMHEGIKLLHDPNGSAIWSPERGIGLPFNFDSDLGSQGSALDIGFSFDPLAASETTRIALSCKPLLELLCFIGLQRFRPREVKGENRFVYTAWTEPLPPSVAALVACQVIELSLSPSFEFRLLYRTKYLKSFLPAQPFQGQRNE